MLRVVLVWPPIRLPRIFAHYPTLSGLGLLYNAAHLRARGFDVRVVDALTLADRLDLRPDGPEFRHVGAEIDELARAVADAAQDATGPVAVVIAVTMFSELNRPRETCIPETAEAVRARLPQASIGLADLYTGGMNYFPYDPRRALGSAPSADWVLVGEGEPTLPTLLERIASGRSIEGLPRVAVRQSTGEVAFDARPPSPCDDLDGFPPPAFDLVDMDRWFSVQADAIRAELVHEYHVVERQLPLLTSRGCPYRCSFCTNQVLALPWRSHSVAWLARTLTELRDRYRVDRFLFLDDNINVDAKRFRELAQWLADAGIAWDAVNGFRADRLELDSIRAIKAAGNTKITVSAESGDPTVVRGLIGKRLELSSVVQVARACEAERIPLQVHYILGVPGETKRQMNRTAEFAAMLFERHGAWPLFQHAIPFPGTKLFRDCEERGWFVAPPFEIPGEVLEQESILRTADFDPGEVMRIKRNAQRRLAEMSTLGWVDLGGESEGGLGSVARAPRPFATRAEIDSAAADALYLGARVILLGGAEPGEREDIVDVVAALHARGVERIAIVGPGTGLADEARVRALARAGLGQLVLELHGPDAATHEAVSRVRGSFEAATACARHCLRAGILLEARASVTRPNLTALPRLVRQAARLGAARIHLELPAPDSVAAREDQIPPWPDARPWLLRALAAGPRGYASLQGIPFCLLREAPTSVAPSPPWVLRRTRSLKAKLARCLDCVAYILCGGFYSSEHDGLYRMIPPGEEEAQGSGIGHAGGEAASPAAHRGPAGDAGATEHEGGPREADGPPAAMPAREGDERP